MEIKIQLFEKEKLKNFIKEHKKVRASCIKQRVDEYQNCEVALEKKWSLADKAGLDELRLIIFHIQAFDYRLH